MKNFKAKKYSNENKFFYEDKLEQKNKKIRSTLILYIFNNLPEFYRLVDLLINENKRRILISGIVWFTDYSSIYDLKPIDIETEIKNFLYPLKDNFNFTSYNLDLAISIIKPFGLEENLDNIESVFITFLIKELNSNVFFLNNFNKNLDSDIFFDLCISYPHLKKYCPKTLREDLNVILDILENN